MDIKYRLWSREPATTAPDLSLTQRLKQLAEENGAKPPADAQAEPANGVRAADSPAEAKAQVPGEPAEAPEKAGRAEAAVPEGSFPANGSGARAREETAVAVAEEEEVTVDRVATEPQNAAKEDAMSSPVEPPEAPNAAPPAGRRVFRLPRWGSKPEELKPVNPGSVAQPPQEQAAEARPQSASSEPSAQADEGQIPEPPAAVGRAAEEVKPAGPSEPGDEAGKTGPETENGSPSVQRALAELQTARQQFEAEMRARLAGALAEMERRQPAALPTEDVTAQLARKAKVAADNISREVQGQARVMLDAVANELRGFRDQFGHEIRERVRLLDRATQQALQLKEKLGEVLPKAEQVLRSLDAAQQEGTMRLQAASAAIEEQLRVSREEISRHAEAQSETLKALAGDCRNDEQRLKEEVDRFHREAEAAGDVFVRVADQSLERLNAGAEEAEGRVRAEVEKLAAEVETRILSGGLVEKATSQIEKAAQEVIEPVLERIRNAGAEADSSADTLHKASHDVVGRFETARKQVETRLDSLMSEQQAVLEAGMAGFQRKATEELGSLVERVVAESSEQLNDRLHALFQDLLVSTSQQINGAARSTLNTLHDGLKEVFEAEAVEQEAESGAIARRD